MDYDAASKNDGADFIKWHIKRSIIYRLMEKGNFRIV